MRIAFAQEIDRTCTRAGGIRVGIWVNVSLKGFRMKTVDFSSAGMSTDIPRPLSGASVAVRNIFVPYCFVPDKTGAGAGTAGAGDDREGSHAAGVAADGEAPRKVPSFFVLHV